MDMTLPEQVRNQMETANKLQAQVYGVKETPAPAENTPVAEPVVAAESAQPDVPEPQQVAPEPAPTPGSDDFKHKYEVLQGKYNAELPRLHQQLRESEQRNRSLEERMEQLERKAAEPKQEQELVSDKDVEDFGSDLVDMVRRAAAETFDKKAAALTSALEKRFAELTSKLGTVEGAVVQNETERFWGKVKSAVPNFDEVNVDPRWIEFLDTAPEFSVETHRELAGKAIAVGDADKVVKLVRAWEATLPATKGKQKQQANQADLERQIAPSTARNSQPAPASAGQKIWSQAEYDYAFSNTARNQLAPNDLEVLQNEAMRAVAEGRIRW